MDAIVERHKIAPMREAIAALDVLVKEWVSAGHIPEVEWTRIRSLDFQEALRARNQYNEKLPSKACRLCEHFDQHVCLVMLLSNPQHANKELVYYHPR